MSDKTTVYRENALTEGQPMRLDGLSPEERLVWLLGDMMNAAENYYGAPNPKREGHIYCAASRIIDEVMGPIRALRDTVTADGEGDL